MLQVPSATFLHILRCHQLPMLRNQVLHLQHPRRLPINPLNRSRSRNLKTNSHQSGLRKTRLQSRHHHIVHHTAQQISFQQPPLQQRPTLDLVQNSAEEATTSSLGLNTPITPAYRTSKHRLFAHEVCILSSPIVSLPARLPNTIIDSAPLQMKSVSVDCAQNWRNDWTRRDAEEREEAIAAERSAATCAVTLQRCCTSP
jgi:hypothetical protein